jgi:fatty acid desaturase
VGLVICFQHTCSSWLELGFVQILPRVSTSVYAGACEFDLFRLLFIEETLDMSQECIDRTHPRPHVVRKQIPATSRPAVTRGLTFWMFLPAVAIVVGATLSFWFERLSLGILCSILIPSYYFLAMCVHDAIHRAAHGNWYLNKAVGWIGAAMIGLPFSVIRRAHLMHHSSLGHDEDVEQFVYRSAWTLPIRLLLVNWRCYPVLRDAPKRERLQAGIVVCCLVAVLLWQPWKLFWGWIIPMQIGVALFALMTVYLPHGPLSGWVMKHIPVVTGFHDDHHATPQYAWYQHFRMRKP